MRPKQLATLLLTLCTYATAFADTFTVTSTADEGAGSLREAITKANSNGIAVTDYIYFNIPEPEFNKRVIRLKTQLPALTSNIVIDGTTQPGERYAITDAKICILTDEPLPEFSMLRIENASHVKIYGLYLYYGYWRGFFGSPYRSELLYGVNLIKSNAIEIGAPGKGNVINGVVHGIYSNSDSCRNVVIRSNYIGHGGYYTDSRGEFDQVVLGTECGITFANVKDITIGGTQPADGNVFGSRSRGVNIDSRYTTKNGYIRIQHNIFGRKYDKQTIIDVFDFWDSYIIIGRSRNNPLNWTLHHEMDYRIEVFDNDISNQLRIEYVSDSMIFKRNRFEGGVSNGSGGARKLSIWRSPGGGIIGDTDPSHVNQFLYKKADSYFSSIAIGESGPITILKNIFDCNSVFGSTTNIGHYIPMPFAQVDINTPTRVAGRAMPNTRVDLYYDDACSACEGKEYITYVMADANGRWEYNATIKGTVVATSTNAKGYTSQFSQPEFDDNNKKVTHPTCGKKNGSITGFTAEGADTYFWINLGTKDTVSRSIDLLDAGPGEYLLYGVHGGTCIRPINQSIRLEDVTPWIRKNWSYVQQPSCGRFNGSINGVEVWNRQNASIQWINSQDQTIGRQLHIGNLGPGTYRIVARDTTPTGGCSDTATFVLTNQSGPTLHTNQVVITNAICNANGSIVGITTTNVTGNPFIQWINENNTPVGNQLNLSNVPGGRYRLRFKDAVNCDTIVTPEFIVPNTGAIVIDSSAKLITASSCQGSTGSIRQLQVSGGTVYEWRKEGSSAILASTPDIQNILAGTYRLTVRNAIGCELVSKPFTVPQAQFTPIAVQGWGSKAANCGLPNGYIGVHSFSTNPDKYQFRWVDSVSKQVVATGTTIQNGEPGTYYLWATDPNGCEQSIFKSTIIAIPIPYFDYTNLKVSPDTCLSGKGGINGITVKDMRGNAGRFVWRNSNKDSIGNTLHIAGLSPGTYYLEAIDLIQCKVTSQPISVANTNTGLAIPDYADVIILKNTPATLTVKNRKPGQYQLLSHAAATVPLAQNDAGVFTTPVLTADQVYYIRLVQGICSSAPAMVKVTVVDKTALYVPSAFTPNADGINDLLRVTIYGHVKLHTFSVYNRWGQAVFTTSDPGKGWDGTFKGKAAETGTYIWMARATDQLNGQVLEHKGTVVIIR